MTLAEGIYSYHMTSEPYAKIIDSKAWEVTPFESHEHLKGSPKAKPGTHSPGTFPDPGLLTRSGPGLPRGLTPPPRGARWLTAAPAPGAQCEPRVSPEAGGGGGYRVPAHPHKM